MSEYRELLIGCGHSREKRVFPPRLGGGWGGAQNEWFNLTTLDNNPACKPDVIFDLSPRLPGFSGDVLPFDVNVFDEIHAYEVLEHIGSQGDFVTFFWQFGEFWRVLKPGGYLCLTVPHWTSIWAWGDPGHTRVINAGTLVFLDKTEYDKQLGVTAMSDYRELLGDTDFERVSQRKVGELFEFVLRARK